MKGSFIAWKGRTFLLKFILLLLTFNAVACQPQPSTITLALLGDLMLGRGIDPKLESFAYLAPDLNAADLTLANLESPFASALPKLDSSKNLCTLSITAELLPAWGFDLLSLANNHSVDCGAGGIDDSRAALEAVGITSIGTGLEPVYRIVRHMQLAFFAFEDVSSPLDENAALLAIRSARDTGFLVIVSVHWGAEYQGGPSDRQKSLARQFAKAGAALVWGHHPHVLQPAAWIETSGGRTLVLYSLGNALFDQGGLENTRQSALVEVALHADGVTSIRIVPFGIDTINSRVIQPDSGTAKIIRDRLNLP
jgi:poly-gamma-glutamate synthesis protein (capsule biosynthesis protein)